MTKWSITIESASLMTNKWSITIKFNNEKHSTLAIYTEFIYSHYFAHHFSITDMNLMYPLFSIYFQLNVYHVVMGYHVVVGLARPCVRHSQTRGYHVVMGRTRPAYVRVLTNL